MKTSKKYHAKETRASILVRYVIVRETWLNDLGVLADSYLSDIHFERLADGDKTDSRIGMIFVNWCIFKLGCYVNFCHACLILIVANDIIHQGIKVVSWRWRVCDINTTSEFSDHV